MTDKQLKKLETKFERQERGALEEYRKREKERAQKALLFAAVDLLVYAYPGGSRGGMVEFRPHEFDDLKNAVDRLRQLS